MISGIYCIQNKIDGKRYIGKSKDVQRRLKGHINFLRKNKHLNIYLQNSWNKYGENNFETFVFEECLEEELNEKEIDYIDKYNTRIPNGYNLTSGGDGLTNPFDETKKKISVNHADVSGKNNPMFGRTGNNSPHYGKKASKETKAKISNAQVGKKNHMYGVFGENHPRYGKTLSDETKQKIKKSNTGRKRQKASSNYYGVYETKDGTWRAYCFDKKVKHIGMFCSEIDAAKAYNKYIIDNKIDRPLNNILKGE